MVEVITLNQFICFINEHLFEKIFFSTQLLNCLCSDIPLNSRSGESVVRGGRCSGGSSAPMDDVKQWLMDTETDQRLRILAERETDSGRESEGMIRSKIKV